ncbi:hypothetical protein SLEP1_g47666 [Rubroshorea leprosula]|uniref:NAC domain-containing protein n=1 Tax=Rubroshorea leprosula TaxID=152421 RepID=A0AAV5LR90_9ROSI|nr:hypothetical protein SLEP1_g47666 [Rubroshorea leprosula]
MEGQLGNFVHPPNSSRWRPPGNEVSDREFMYVLDEKVNNGRVDPPFSYMVTETDILAGEPWQLPVTTDDLRWYFSKRKTKTERTERIDRTIAQSDGNSRWHQYGNVEEIKDYDDNKWGEKRPFKHRINNNNTGWHMREYILDRSRVAPGSDNHIVFCRIFYKEEQ